MRVAFPNVLALDERRVSNRIRQLGARSVAVEGRVATFARGRVHGHLFQPTIGGDQVLVVPNGKKLVEGHSRVLHAAFTPGTDDVDLTNGVWLRHPLISPAPSPAPNSDGDLERVLQSWAGAFSYVSEDPARGIKGLRGPQLAALHAIQAHWGVSENPATIVMPTGTGKTDTMIAVLVSAICRKLLVVVPTDALRTQLGEKFLTLGILGDPGCSVLGTGALFPIVGTLQHIPRDAGEVNEIFERCHVVVTTSSIAGQCKEDVQDRMAFHSPYLFIDEAHHAEAPTWSAFKERFRQRRILQFTATPFREDGKPLDGDIIFRYPLRRAQVEGYFKPIRFSSVVEFNPAKADQAIAAKAVEQLRNDFDRGHILMARVDSVERAKRVFHIYSQYPEFKPVELHTGIKSQRQRELIRQQIISGESRLVVCVDMLGEGFDLPELKIAAFHDIRKTLAVTLQLAGRFTRARPDLGDATFIANTADINVQDELRKLYTRDPDWNTLLPQLSDTMIGEQLSLQEFLRGFTAFPGEVSLKGVRPATSAVVYRTTCPVWSPDRFRDGIPGLAACEQVHHTVNAAKHTLVVVTARRSPLPWTEAETLYSWDWELYVLVWSAQQNLLFINSSTNAGEYKALAHAVAGPEATLIKGQDVFRTFAGISRLRLQNVGLTEQLGRNVRYTGRMGSDVAPALTDMQRRRSRKAVLSGSGFELGRRTTIGASRKGRVWSFRKEHVDGFVAWCRQVGAKLVDDTIDPDEVLKGTLEAKTVTLRPTTMPIGVDWPEEMYTSTEATWWVVIGAQEWPLAEVGIELVTPDVAGVLKIAIASESERIELELELFEEEDRPNYRFLVVGDQRVSIRRGSSAGGEPIAEFFYDSPPVIWFSDGSSLEGNEHVELKRQLVPYDASKIQAWSWVGVDLRKESQGPGKDPSSIQARVIRELVSKDYSVIVDDDGKGEIADVVAIRLLGEEAADPSGVEIELYHCKYSSGAAPGRRIKDLYEVCGQAQKSISWMSSPERQSDMFTHLLRREARRQESGRPSRFELGDQELLLTIREISRLRPVSLRIYIVQPGVSKSNVSRDQLELMSVTENHLMETYQLPFSVIASA